MYTNTVIPAAFASACGHVASWTAPVQGIRMSVPALPALAVDMDANRKQGTTGYLAFEDPL